MKTGEVTVINIRQQKTGAKVTIPCSSQLLKILEKYDYNLPHLADQNINEYIKMVAKAAGMTEKVEIMTISWPMSWRWPARSWISTAISTKENAWISDQNRVT